VILDRNDRRPIIAPSRTVIDGLLRPPVLSIHLSFQSVDGCRTWLQEGLPNAALSGGALAPSASAHGQGPISCRRARFAVSPADPPPQKLTTLDSEIRLANLMGSMKEAFKLLRSLSVTPRATEQAPQTKTGTFALTTLSISSGRGGKPTP
jgi:hypothetical protein